MCNGHHLSQDRVDFFGRLTHTMNNNDIYGYRLPSELHLKKIKFI